MEGLTLLQGNDFLWKENLRLQQENRMLRQQLKAHEDESAARAKLEQRCQQLQSANKTLTKRLAELTEQLKTTPKPQPPPFIKPNTKHKRRKTPGRKIGHPAALRPKPQTIDFHQQVPLPIDLQGQPCCPECNTQLSNVQSHERLVEETIPATVQVTCYHTSGGYCPHCRKSVESRAPEQPPAADLPHAQLGLNALATAAVMRVCYRLPLRQISRLFADLPGLAISPGGISKQLVRLSKWLEGQYHRLKLMLRVSGVVYADETSWRKDGRNAQLWTLTNDTHTLYHVDKSRGGKVIGALLGETFGSDGRGTLVSDFYSAYDRMEGPQQKCLVHLLRELKETVQRRSELCDHDFFKRAKRLVKDMLRLKARRSSLSAEAYAHQVKRVEKRLEVLGQTRWNDADADRLAGRLAKYETKLTTFLHRAEVDGTNNAAERALRPAVVMRKITGGSRSDAGAKAWSILASVMRTAEQQGRNVLETIKTLLKAHWAGENITLLTDLLTPAQSNTS